MYFYDDSIENIEMVKKRKDITSVWVSNKTPNAISPNKFEYVKLFQKRYPKNNYAKTIDPSTLCNMTLGSGLTIDEIRKITHTYAKVVLFDWDLTLSVFNGTYVPGRGFTFHKDISFEEVAHFYAGTLRRFEALKSMFKALRENGTRIYILTNSAWGSHPKEFVKILRVYDPKMITKEILYGNMNKLRKINQVFTRKLKTYYK
jgi:hypothetical protein